MALTDYEKRTIDQLIGIEYVVENTDGTSKILESELSDGIINLKKILNGDVPPDDELDTLLKIFKDPKVIVNIIDNQRDNESRSDSLARPTFGEVRVHFIEGVDKIIKNHLENYELSNDEIGSWDAKQMLERVSGMADHNSVIETQISTIANQNILRVIPNNLINRIRRSDRNAQNNSASQNTELFNLIQRNGITEELNRIGSQSYVQPSVNLGMPSNSINRTGIIDNNTLSETARRTTQPINLLNISEEAMNITNNLQTGIDPSTLRNYFQQPSNVERRIDNRNRTGIIDNNTQNNIAWQNTETVNLMPIDFRVVAENLQRPSIRITEELNRIGSQSSVQPSVNLGMPSNSINRAGIIDNNTQNNIARRTTQRNNLRDMSEETRNMILQIVNNTTTPDNDFQQPLNVERRIDNRNRTGIIDDNTQNNIVRRSTQNEERQIGRSSAQSPIRRNNSSNADENQQRRSPSPRR